MHCSGLTGVRSSLTCNYITSVAVVISSWYVGPQLVDNDSFVADVVGRED